MKSPKRLRRWLGLVITGSGLVLMFNQAMSQVLG